MPMKPPPPTTTLDERIDRIDRALGVDDEKLADLARDRRPDAALVPATKPPDPVYEAPAVEVQAPHVTIERAETVNIHAPPTAPAPAAAVGAEEDVSALVERARAMRRASPREPDATLYRQEEPRSTMDYAFALVAPVDEPKRKLTPKERRNLLLIGAGAVAGLVTAAVADHALAEHQPDAGDPPPTPEEAARYILDAPSEVEQQRRTSEMVESLGIARMAPAERDAVLAQMEAAEQTVAVERQRAALAEQARDLERRGQTLDDQTRQLGITSAQTANSAAQVAGAAANVSAAGINAQATDREVAALDRLGSRVEEASRREAAEADRTRSLIERHRDHVDRRFDQLEERGGATASDDSGGAGDERVASAIERLTGGDS